MWTDLEMDEILTFTLYKVISFSVQNLYLYVLDASLTYKLLEVQYMCEINQT